MPANALARALASAAGWVKTRKHAAVVGVATIALLGTGALGAHALSADTANTSTTADTASSPRTSSLPVSNAGPKNVVIVQNRTDDAVKIAGRVQLGREPGPGMGAVNIASAFSSCTDCTTLAVALQINLFNRNAHVLTPQNAATAVNGACTRCVTEAFAFQYNIGVDDPTAVPPRVNQLVAQMKQELAQAGAGHTSLNQAVSEINTVIGEYQDLTAFLSTRHEAATSPDSSPAPSPSESASPGGGTPSPSSNPTASPSDQPSPSPT